MYPILFQWGDIVIPAWHTMYASAAIAAYFLAQHLRQIAAPAISDREVANLFVLLYISGYFGARTLSLFVDERVQSIGEFVTGLGQFGAMTFYGGFLACFFIGMPYCLYRQLPIPRLMDILLPGGLLALAIGRFGCFLNGDDFGLPIGDQNLDPWWGVVFPNLGDGLIRYPVQIISTLVVGTFVGIIVWQYRRLVATLPAGVVGIGCVQFYGIFRFVIEFYRGDLRGSILGNALSTSQFISIITLFFSGLLLVLILKGVKDQQPAPPNG